VKKWLASVLVMVVALPTPAYAAAVKPGAPCSSKHATKVIKDVRYTCIPLGSRLVWDKGVALKVSKKQVAIEAAKQAAQISAGEFVTLPERKKVRLTTWSGTDLDGKTWTTKSLTDRVTVINIWASWCAPCKEEWPVLQSVAAANPAIRFVGINSQDRLEKAKEFLLANPSGYEHVFDERGVIKASLTTVPNYALPITIVLDKRGRVIAWITGAIKAEPLEKILKKLGGLS
jgi:thiol-disulfide isomerase/thioredoxin